MALCFLLAVGESIKGAIDVQPTMVGRVIISYGGRMHVRPEHEVPGDRYIPLSHMGGDAYVIGELVIEDTM